MILITFLLKDKRALKRLKTDGIMMIPFKF